MTNQQILENALSEIRRCFCITNKRESYMQKVRPYFGFMVSHIYTH